MADLTDAPMNRPIKFRAFAEGKMYGVDELSWKYGKPDSLLLVDGEGRFSIEEVKLMQFTGLLDKNGKEIYEGDLVKSPKLYDKGYYVGAIEWNNYNHGWGGPLGVMHDGVVWESKDLEILGNIYENPELIKQNA